MNRILLLRIIILIVMFGGIAYSIWQFFERSKTSLVSLPSLIGVFLVSLIGIYIYFPRKNK